MNVTRITVLISGNGSNLQALIDAQGSGRLKIDIVQVISNRPHAKGLQRAADAGIPCAVLDHQEFSDRAEFDLRLAQMIAASGADWIVLAGFMRIIGKNVLDHFAGRMINLHPSLLPLYRGTNTYQRALEAGDSEYGASIHFVTEDLDGGPVIAQIRLPIFETDDRDSLATRLAPGEHRLLVATMEFLCDHEVECRDSTVFTDGNQMLRTLQLQADDTLS